MTFITCHYILGLLKALAFEVWCDIWTR